jgi:hypothetical protein
MLNGFETLHPLDKAALQEPIPFGTRLMKVQGGTKERMATWEIGHLEHVLRYARNLEELRQICLRCMTDPLKRKAVLRLSLPSAPGYGSP